uniref:Protein kinase domain-containing protein n=1 Tax=Heterorhabditis bacteriophora TaxID=37862 RepID=A0A1I7X5V5_HETBA
MNVNVWQIKISGTYLERSDNDDNSVNDQLVMHDRRNCPVDKDELGIYHHYRCGEISFLDDPPKLRKTMMKKERWNCEADNFLRNPPMKSRFKKCRIFNNLGNGTAFSSRYRTDFEELEAIGEGGFGTVYKVKSRIDNCLYAVKKIRIKRNLTNIPLKVLSEVQVLASLQHENVVRYHCGWVEMEQPQNMYRQEWVRNGAAIPMKIMEM